MRGVVIALTVLAISTGVDARPRRGRCRETSLVVGHRQCTQFGSSWSTPEWVPSLMIDVGAAAYRLSPESLPRTIPRSTGTSTDPSAVTAFAPTLRLSFAARAHYYFGVEASAGAIAFDSNTTSGGYVRGGGVVGVQSASSRLRLAAELAVGHDMVLARRRGIDGSPPPILRSDIAVDGRVRAGLWVSPWISVDASFGASAMHRDEVSVCLSVGFHGRAYDGRR